MLSLIGLDTREWQGLVTLVAGRASWHCDGEFANACGAESRETEECMTSKESCTDQ